MLEKINSQTDVREGYISVTGGKIWYRIIGAEKKGIPLLTLHGGPGVPHDYLEPLGNLSTERPVIFYDQLGCGNSDKTTDKTLWTIEHFVEELVQLRLALKLETLHILGQSWGSMLAIDYMLCKKPAAVLSLVLSGPCLSASRWAQDQKNYIKEFPGETQTLLEKIHKSGDFDSEEYQNIAMRYYKLHVCRLNPWPEYLESAFKRQNYEIYKYMWGPSEFNVLGTLKDYERSEQLKEIKIPALFTCGRYDEAAPATTQYYHNKLPNSQLVIFEGASHLHHIEKTKEYIKVVRDFLTHTEKQTVA